MAITVDGYGNITQSNAKEIYVAWKRGEVELDKSQQAKCESFLTPEDMDEIQYDTKSAEKQGADKINTENTEEKGNWQGKTACGTVSAAVASIMFGAAISNICGFVANAMGEIAILTAGATLGLSFFFDESNFKNREDHSNNAANDNQTMDNYSDTLGANMDKMNEDAELYKNQQDELTTTVNEQTSQGASLQMEIDAAEAAGDTEKVKSLKEQLKALGEEDNSELTDGLDETRGLLDGYRAYNAEALGCAGSGQKVSDFLKAGKPQGKLALANAILATTGALFALIGAASSLIPKIWILGVPTDLPFGIKGSISWGLTSAMMTYAATNFYSKASTENKCGDNGDEMQEHVNTLNDMAEQQSAYVDDTEGSYDESDKGAAGSKENGKKSAGKAVDTNKDNLNADNNNTAKPQ